MKIVEVVEDVYKRQVLTYVFLIFVGFFMIYPLIWLFFSTFKDNTELFGSIALIPQNFS